MSDQERGRSRGAYASWYAIDVERLGDPPAATFKLSASCEHGKVDATYRPTCRDHRGDATPEERALHDATCLNLNPPDEKLRQYIMGLHFRRFGNRDNKYPRGCACNDAFWAHEGPPEVYAPLHPCRTKEGPVDAATMAALGVQGVKQGPWTGFHALDAGYIGTIDAAWPYSTGSGVGASPDHPKMTCPHPNHNHAASLFRLKEHTQ